jgi:glycosyltransferase involved in cell wall biosynthesis
LGMRTSRANVLRLAVVSTFPPRRCGIATYSRDLLQSVRGYGEPHRPGPGRLHRGERAVEVEVISPDSDRWPSAAEVRLTLPSDRRSDYAVRADGVNQLGYDVVNLQHEYGIYAGLDGEWIVDFAARVDAPLVTTLHTVLAQPSSHQRTIVEELARHSAWLVVLSRAAADRLTRYEIDPARVLVIPHGVPDLPFVDPALAKPEFGLSGRPTILSFGLLGPGKGYELAIRAMPKVIQDAPNACYVVLGATHPELRRRDGEAYRESLERLVTELALEEHVRFVDAYVDQPTLGRWLQASDVYVTPYPNPDQVVSGTLAYALGAGKALVSTPFAYARELLAAGRGALVPFDDPSALGVELCRFLTDPVERDRARRAAYQYGRSMLWSVVGESYRRLFEDVATAFAGDSIRSARHWHDGTQSSREVVNASES